MKLKYVLLAGLAVSLVHCSKDSNSSSDDGDVVVVDLPIKIKPDAKLQSEKKAVADSVSAKKGISFRQVTKLMIEKHVKASKNSSVTSAIMQEFVKSISPDSSLNPAQTKVHYEEKISKKHGGKPLIYNASKNNVVDIYSENRVQCYSGTYLYELVRRQQKPSTFRSGNEVVIFTSGHVQPGYMIKAKESWFVMGIETTQSGGARVPFGYAKDMVSGVTIIDAELFALTEVFADEISNPVEVANEAIKITAKKYGIPVKELSTHDVGDAGKSRELNQSIFAFGRADDTPVDKNRNESGDDGKEADVKYTEGQRSVSEKSLDPVMIMEFDGCQIINGTYTSKDNIIAIKAKSCAELQISEYRAQSGKNFHHGTPYIYKIVNMDRISSSRVRLLVQRLDYAGSTESFEFNINAKYIRWDYKIYRYKNDKTEIENNGYQLKKANNNPV